MSSFRGSVWMMFLVVSMGLMLAAVGCGKKSEKPATDPTTSTSTTGAALSGSQILTSAQEQRSALESGKTNGQSTTTPPQPVPKGTSQGGTDVQPPQPSGNTFLVWEVSAIDFDGDGVTEDGVAMIDSSNTLYVWWSDVSWWSDDELDGFLWLADQSAGFILLLDDSVGLGCAEETDDSGGAAGCIGCDAAGDCEVIVITETWTGEN